MLRQVGLKPLIGRNARVLILGSFPSPRSLETGEYYANPHNHFWRIMAGLLGGDLHISCAWKREILRDHGIALWDVIQSCERIGALDKNIRNPELNRLASFLRRHGSIRLVLLNGRVAEKHYQRCDGDLPVGMYLPSSSGACAITIAEKIRQWRAAVDAGGCAMEE